MAKLERRIEFTPAFDRRDPDPYKNYGVQGVEMHWYLVGPKGVVQFVVYTRWHLPNVIKELAAKASDSSAPSTFQPMGAYVGYHSYVPLYEGHRDTGPCRILGREHCYYERSGFEAGVLLALLIEKGSEAVWPAMEDLYINKLAFDIDIYDEEDDGPLRLPTEE